MVNQKWNAEALVVLAFIILMAAGLGFLGHAVLLNGGN